MTVYGCTRWLNAAAAFAFLADAALAATYGRWWFTVASAAVAAMTAAIGWWLRRPQQ